MAGARKPVIDPATLETGRRHRRGDAMARSTRCSTAATKAQAAWKKLDAKSRAKHLHAVANAIEAADFTRCAELMVREMGKPYPGSDRRDRQLRADLPLLCRDGARRGRQDRRHDAGRLVPVCALRALWRLRAHHALQFPDPADVLDRRRFACRRQCLHHQAGRGDDAVDARLHDRVPLAAGGAGLLPARRRRHRAGADRFRAAPMPSPSPARSLPARRWRWPAPSA